MPDVGSRAGVLTLRFESAILVDTVRIWEHGKPTTGSMAVGSVKHIQLVDVSGRSHDFWKGEDATPCRGVLEARGNLTRFLVTGLVLHS